MRLLFTTECLHPERGGTAATLAGLCTALAHSGTQPEIVTLDYGPDWGTPLLPPAAAARSTLVPAGGTLAQRFRYTPRYKQTLHERCRVARIEILHDNGIWLLPNHAAAAVARELKIPLIISPHGMLNAWALAHRGWKKKLALALYQRRDLATAGVLHATAAPEAAALRALGFRQPIAIVPNGVELPPPAPATNTNSRPEIKTALFLGRIHPIKGLVNLVAAWATVRPPGWRMVIAGGDEAGHLAEVQAEVRRHGQTGNIEFIGPVAADARWNLYRSADLFVLPSHSENFGLVAAEALACGLPVLTTQSTPWQELPEQRCGWWVESGIAPLAAALREAANLTDEQRRTMGRRGRELVERKYGWASVANQMNTVYRWMLGQGDQPEFILAD